LAKTAGRPVASAGGDAEMGKLSAGSKREAGREWKLRLMRARAPASSSWHKTRPSNDRNVALAWPVNVRAKRSRHQMAASRNIMA